MVETSGMQAWPLPIPIKENLPHLEGRISELKSPECGQRTLRFSSVAQICSTQLGGDNIGKCLKVLELSWEPIRCSSAADTLSPGKTKSFSSHQIPTEPSTTSVPTLLNKDHSPLWGYLGFAGPISYHPQYFLMRRGNWSLGWLCHFSKLSNETRAFLQLYLAYKLSVSHLFPWFSLGNILP